MDFGNTIRTLIAAEPSRESNQANAPPMNADSNEKIVGGVNSRPAVQLKEIIALVGYVLCYFPLYTILFLVKSLRTFPKVAKK